MTAQATVRKAIVFTCRSYNRYQHNMMIIPLPVRITETAWYDLVLLSSLQYLNIPVGLSRVLDFANIL